MGGVLGKVREVPRSRKNGEGGTKKPANSNRFLSLLASAIPEDEVRPSPSSSEVSSPNCPARKGFEDARKQTDRKARPAQTDKMGRLVAETVGGACPKGGRGLFAV